MKSLPGWSLGLLQALLCGLVQSAVAQSAVAQSVLDQENDRDCYLSAYCAQDVLSLCQSFTPRLTPLVAVELDANLVPAGGDSVRVRVWSVYPGGDILAAATAFAAANGWVHVDLPSELQLVPGRTYVIEWVHPRGWLYRDDDPYPEGEAYDCVGGIRPSWDFNFRTYSHPVAAWGDTWGRVKSVYGLFRSP